MDYKFHACGDYTNAYLPYVSNSSEETGKEVAILNFTLTPSNLKIVHAKSYIHGFNIKSEKSPNKKRLMVGKLIERKETQSPEQFRVSKFILFSLGKRGLQVMV